MLRTIGSLLGVYSLPVVQLLAVCLAWNVNVARADTVWLENGDVISGKIEKLESGQLSLSTRYAGTINVSWRYVRAIHGDEPLWVSMIGESQASKRLLESKGKRLTIIDEDGYARSFSAAWPVAGITRKKPVLADEWEVTGSIGVSFDSKKGNKDELIISVDGNLGINDRWNKNLIKWDVEVENKKGVRTSEWELGYSYSRYLTEHWFVKGAADQSHDSAADLQLRTSFGASGGYRFWETLDGTLLTSVGVTHLWEDYKNENDQKHYALTWDIHYRKVFPRGMEYFLDNKVFYRLGSGNKLIVDGEHGLKISLTEALELKLSHYFDYDGRPVDDAEKTDNQVKLGIGYKW